MADAINLPTLSQKIKLDTSEYDASMKQASTSSEGLKSKLSGVSNLMSTGVAVAAGVAATAIAGFGTFAVNAGMSFESSMSQVAATMGMTAEEIANGSENYNMLRDAAIEAGASSKYSASQAADALNYLALAGYDSAKACEVLPSVLNLAAAGGMELAAASDMITDSMSALNIEATKTNVDSFADQLAKASQKSNTSVSQLGNAILTVGGTAKSLSGGTVELSTALGILADNGIKGAEGGTVLRNTILSLSAPTDKAAAQMEALGLNAFDAEGNLRPLNEVFKDLDSSLASMTDEQKKQALSTIFNKTDLKGIEALIANCGTRFDELSGYISEADGACASMAETMSANLEGQIASLQSAMESLGIAVFEKVRKPLTELATVGADSVRTLASAFNEGGVAGMMSAAGDIINGFISGFMQSAPNLASTAMQSVGYIVSGIISAIPSMASSAIQLVGGLINGILSAIPDLIQSGTQIISSLTSGVDTGIPNIVTTFLNVAQTIANTIINTDWIKLGTDIINAIGNGIISVASSLQSMIGEVAAYIHDTLVNVDWFTLGSTVISTIGNGILSLIPTLVDMAMQAANAMHEIIKNTDWLQLGADILSILGNGILGALAGLLDIALSVGGSVLDAIKNISWVQLGIDLIKFIVNGITSTASAFVDGAKNVGSQALDAIKNIDWLALGKSVITFIANGVINTASTLSNGAKNVADQAKNAIKNIDWLALGKTVITTVKNGIVNTASTLSNGAKSVASQAKNAIKNVDWLALGKSVITTVKNGVTGAVNTLTNGAKNVASQAKEAFKNIDWSGVGKNIITGIVNGISGAAGRLYDSLKNLASNALGAAKKALGIHSPSRVFRDEVGKYMAEGIGVGFDAEMQNVNKDIQKSLNTDFEINPNLTTNLADRKALAGTSISASAISNINMGDIIVNGNADASTVEQIKSIVDDRINRFDEAMAGMIRQVALAY